MNERIEELSSQAWHYADSNSVDGDGRHGHLYRDKFAELIVQECAKYMYENYPETRYKVNYMRKHMGDPDWTTPIGEIK